MESGPLLSFLSYSSCVTITPWRTHIMKPDIKELRRKYMENPPEGLTSEDIRHMSEDDLLDMDYFLNEELDDDFGEEGFYIF